MYMYIAYRPSIFSQYTKALLTLYKMVNILKCIRTNCYNMYSALCAIPNCLKLL